MPAIIVSFLVALSVDLKAEVLLPFSSSVVTSPHGPKPDSEVLRRDDGKLSGRGV